MLFILPLSLYSQGAVSEDTSVLRAIVTNVGVLLTTQEVEISGQIPLCSYILSILSFCTLEILYREDSCIFSGSLDR